MATISTALRNHKEPTKDDLNRIFFGIPDEVMSNEDLEAGTPTSPSSSGDRMEINAVLSMGEQGVEDAYVRVVSLLSLEFNLYSHLTLFYHDGCSGMI